MTATVQPIRSDADIYAAARMIIFTAGDDWTVMLAAAAKLMDSPDAGDKAIARNVRAKHIAHLNRQMDAMAQREADETSVKIAMRYRPHMLQIALGVTAAVIVSIAFHYLTH